MHLFNTEKYRNKIRNFYDIFPRGKLAAEYPMKKLAI